MSFNSIEFALFLPVVFLLYWLVFQRNLRLQNLFVVAVSYLFYGWWDVRFLLLIALTTLVSFTVGLLIKRFPHRAWWLSAGNIVLNLGVLVYYKYCNFFIESFVEAFRLLGKPLLVDSLSIILPVGISFYTFQALSYTIDVYKKKIEATDDVVSFFAFVSFFPQLVAGPIERATNLLPQFQVKRTFSYPLAVDGTRQILWGLFKKMVIADNCATIVNRVYDNYTNEPSVTLVCAAICFSIQIYCDFSGYSDIAIGTARLFGFRLMRNFNYPYFSRDIAEFWRRWHISLTTWFRDYVYIPLGGSRGGRLLSIRNTMAIFLLSGLWHGANLTFVVWGAFHALLFLPLLLRHKNRRYTGIPGEGRLLPSLGEFISMGYTFLLATIGWIFFRSDSMSQAFGFISGILHPPYWGISGLGFKFAFILIAFLFVCEWIQRDKEHVLQIDRLPCWSRYLVYSLLAMGCIYYSVLEETPFIYFQF